MKFATSRINLNIVVLLFLGAIFPIACISCGKGDSRKIQEVSTKNTTDLEAPEVVFERMEKAIKANNEALFKAQWHPQGYDANLVGDSGLSGASVFEQATRKHWFIKPHLNKRRDYKDGTVYLFPCDVWKWWDSRRVDSVHAAVILKSRRWVVLGAGEELEEVEALVQRFLKPSKD